jgi:branched-chain amino acid aminotransferase
MPRPDSIPAAFQVPFRWLDGEFVPSEQAVVSVMTHTLHYGLGVFEGIRAYEGDGGPAVFRLREHVERLFRSAALCHIQIPFTVDELCAACTGLLQRNELASGYLRPVVFIGDGARGLGAVDNAIHVAIVCWPWGRYLGDEGIQKGITAHVSSFMRMTGRSFLPKGKINGQYVNSILAKRAATHAGYQEAILLDEEGFIAEATGENLFLVRRGVVMTPSLSQPILAGITRDSVLTLARELELEVHEERFARDTLLTADEVFLTGTAAEITPVRAIDGHAIGTGARGPITEKLQARFFDTVHGRVAEHRDWLTPYRTTT